MTGLTRTYMDWNATAPLLPAVRDVLVSALEIAGKSLDQARIVEGEPVADAAAFSRRLAAMMEKGLAGETAGAKAQK